ncbi:MAG TPA: type II toxin-antitoxin system HicA family toxin [Planctomycetota bacterium]|jgi:predicted RNA binding protein YcfA (HicA-like mRNA interferase family)
MKRRDLLRHLNQHGCYIAREGAKHSFLVNPASRATSALPRHREIKNPLARAVCKDLGVPLPGELG